jgi:hypothetical protein
VGRVSCNGRYCITEGNRPLKMGGVPAPGTRSRRSPRCYVRRDPVPSKAGDCPERPREIGAGALRSRPLRLRLRRSRPAPTTRGTSGVGDEYFATCDGVNIMIAPVAIQTGWNRDPKIQQSDFERVVGRVWVCSRLSWIFGALFFCEEMRLWSGLGSAGVGGPPRVDPCDALRRPVPRQALAVLSGADSAPAPPVE